MTYKFTPPDWSGKTVAVLASGKSLTQELADSVKHLRRIAVRRAFRLALDSDIVLALDAPPNYGFWDESEGIKGERVCGVQVDRLCAAHVHIPHERVVLAPGHVIEVRNNGLAAIRLAAMTGASNILLVGFDEPPYDHFYGEADPDWDQYPGLAEGITQLTVALQAVGVVVERLAPGAPVAPEKRKKQRHA